MFFTPEELFVPAGWQLVLQKAIFQMVYEQVDSPSVDDQELLGLQEKDIPDMLDLTALTKPGPFLSRTIEFGHYEGIYNATKVHSSLNQIITLNLQVYRKLKPDHHKRIAPAGRQKTNNLNRKT